MKVEIKTDKTIPKDTIIILSNEKNSTVKNIMKYIQNIDVIVYKSNEKYLISLEDIESFCTEQGKVLVKTANDKYIIKNRIYELEEKLKNTRFVRISNSEIVNINKVEKMKYETGSICLYFKSGNSTYVSRRYIKRVKEFIYKEVKI